jgi:hypothetical protein
MLWWIPYSCFHFERNRLQSQSIRISETRRVYMKSIEAAVAVLFVCVCRCRLLQSACKWSGNVGKYWWRKCLVLPADTHVPGSLCQSLEGLLRLMLNVWCKATQAVKVVAAKPNGKPVNQLWITMSVFFLALEWQLSFNCHGRSVQETCFHHCESTGCLIVELSI